MEQVRELALEPVLEPGLARGLEPEPVQASVLGPELDLVMVAVA